MATERPPVLVVDDDPLIRKMLRIGLGWDGYTVYEAPDGAVALAHLRATTDRMIVLLGIMMPVMNGFEVLQSVVADTTLATQHRYIIVTGSYLALESPEGQQMLAQLDAPIVRKPFTPAQILDAVEQARLKLV